MVAVSLDGKMVNVCVRIPISTPTLSSISQFFSGKKVTAPQVRRCPYAYADANVYVHAGTNTKRTVNGFCWPF